MVGLWLRFPHRTHEPNVCAAGSQPQRSKAPLLSRLQIRRVSEAVVREDEAVTNQSCDQAYGADTSAGDFLLGEQDGAIDLRPPGEHGRPGVQAIFPPDARSTQGGSPGKNPLVKAFGPHIDQIIDLTAGFGGDAFRLAEAGYPVRAFERDSRVFAVLESGWDRACREGRVSEEVSERLSFEYGEGADQLASIVEENVGVYIDPMYPPPRKKNAKPRRELQILRELLGEQLDGGTLVSAARERAARVVVKRPHHAEVLLPGANHQIETKLVRFDVYLNPARMGVRS